MCLHVCMCARMCVCACVCVSLKLIGLHESNDLVSNICLVSLLVLVEMTPLFHLLENLDLIFGRNIWNIMTVPFNEKINNALELNSSVFV